MTVTRTSLSLSIPARDRLVALSKRTGISAAELLDVLSYADQTLILQTVARRAAADTKAGREPTVGDKPLRSGRPRGAAKAVKS